jgi:hypothetical protein
MDNVKIRRIENIKRAAKYLAMIISPIVIGDVSKSSSVFSFFSSESNRIVKTGTIKRRINNVHIKVGVKRRRWRSIKGVPPCRKLFIISMLFLLISLA